MKKVETSCEPSGWNSVKQSKHVYKRKQRLKKICFAAKVGNITCCFPSGMSGTIYSVSCLLAFNILAVQVRHSGMDSDSMHKLCYHNYRAIQSYQVSIHRMQVLVVQVQHSGVVDSDSMHKCRAIQSAVHHQCLLRL